MVQVVLIKTDIGVCVWGASPKRLYRSSYSYSKGKGLLGGPLVSAAPRSTRAVPSLVTSVKGSLFYASPNSTGSNSSSSSSMEAAKWTQKTVTINPNRRGCHLITSKIVDQIRGELSGFRCGLAHLFLQHTSASLTINENCDSDVRVDTETFLNTIVPEGASAPWKHTLEGPDDMPAHIKSSMFGCSLTIPITDGKLNMGTWQGIWLCEHRDYPSARKIVVTLNGI